MTDPRELYETFADYKRDTDAATSFTITRDDDGFTIEVDYAGITLEQTRHLAKATADSIDGIRRGRVERTGDGTCTAPYITDDDDAAKSETIAPPDPIDLSAAGSPPDPASISGVPFPATMFELSIETKARIDALEDAIAPHVVKQLLEADSTKSSAPSGVVPTREGEFAVTDMTFSMPTSDTTEAEVTGLFEDDDTEYTVDVEVDFE